jgi:hypothetical protein
VSTSEPGQRRCASSRGAAAEVLAHAETRGGVLALAAVVHQRMARVIERYARVLAGAPAATGAKLSASHCSPRT